MKYNTLGSIAVLAILFVAFSVRTTAAQETMISTAIPLPTEIHWVVPEPFNYKPFLRTELDCMTMNLYFEARGTKTDEAIAAVGFIVVNRTNSRFYPQTVCGVVYQPGQFSWVRSGSHRINEPSAWKHCREIARRVLTRTISNPIADATMYHTTAVNPNWGHVIKVKQIGTHIFYKPA